MRAHGGKPGYARREVRADALALEVVAEVEALEQEREAVLQVIHLIELAMVGLADRGDPDGEEARPEQRLLELNPVERALATECVFHAAADARQHRVRRLRLISHSQAQRIDAVVVDHGPQVLVPAMPRAQRVGSVSRSSPRARAAARLDIDAEVGLATVLAFLERVRRRELE